MAEAADAIRRLGERSHSPRVARAIGDWLAVVQFELNGEEQPVHAIFASGQLEVREGRHLKPTAIVTGSAAAAARVASGAIDITHLIACGELDFSGRYYDLINFSRVASAQARK